MHYLMKTVVLGLTVFALGGCATPQKKEADFSKLQKGMGMMEMSNALCGGSLLGCPTPSDHAMLTSPPGRKMRYEHVGTLVTTHINGNEMLSDIQPDKNAAKYFRLDSKMNN